jgi:hypothetical protein
MYVLPTTQGHHIMSQRCAPDEAVLDMKLQGDNAEAADDGVEILKGVMSPLRGNYRPLPG